ncbi:MAG: helix-turn-helix domain-containing protein [Lentisphaerae bacterium]|nr:MAG: helix-turn-helix domain-containing protein [Lentisphaerota bacterium]
MKSCQESIIVPAACVERYITFAHHPNEHFFGTGINFACLSRLVRGYSILRDPSPHHQVLFLTEGEGYCETDRFATVMKAGDFVFMRSGTRQHFRTDGQMAFAALHLDPASPVWSNLFHAESIIHRGKNNVHVARLFEMLLDYASEPGPEKIALLSGLCRVLVHLIELELDRGHRHGQVSLRMRLEALFREVTQHPQRPWDMEILRRKAALSLPHFYACCKRYFGRPPMQIVRDARLARAKYLLRHSTLSLKEIAEQCGYADIYSFSKFFRKNTGMAPGQYRQR